MVQSYCFLQSQDVAFANCGSATSRSSKVVMKEDFTVGHLAGDDKFF